MYTIAQLKSDLQGMLKGTSLNKVAAPYDLISRAARDVLSDVDPAETKRTMPISNAIFDKVYDYAAPVDLKESKVIDIRAQVNRGYGETFQQSYSAGFDSFKLNNYQFSVENNSGIKSLRIARPTIAGVLIDPFDALTGWVIGGTGSNLVLDSVNYITGGGSLSFTATGAGIATLVKASITPVDLTTQLNQGSQFLWHFIPDATLVTSVTLRYGSSPLNYYQSIVTQGQIGAFVTGWNLLRFDWATATVVGAPVVSAISYVYLGMAHTATLNNVRYDSLMSNLPTLFSLIYYSKYLFATNAGVWKETATADDDTVNLNTASYNLLLYKTAELAALNIQQAIPLRGKLINFDQSIFGSEYDKALLQYKADNKSEALPLQSVYYRTPRTYSARGNRVR